MSPTGPLVSLFSCQLCSKSSLQGLKESFVDTCPALYKDSKWVPLPLLQPLLCTSASLPDCQPLQQVKTPISDLLIQQLCYSVWVSPPCVSAGRMAVLSSGLVLCLDFPCNLYLGFLLPNVQKQLTHQFCPVLCLFSTGRRVLRLTVITRNQSIISCYLDYCNILLPIFLLPLLPTPPSSQSSLSLSVRVILAEQLEHAPLLLKTIHGFLGEKKMLSMTCLLFPQS